MIGPELICATLSRPRLYGSGVEARPWQYHSRSDFHSKLAATALLVDLLQESDELQRDVASGVVGMAINPKLTDRRGRVKTLDMMLCRIDDARPVSGARSLLRVMEDLGVVATDDQWQVIRSLPQPHEARSKQELVVLENKACMTAHSKAAPRLRNELDGASDAINGSDEKAIAAGLVLVNSADWFVSPVFRQNGSVEPGVRRPSHHNQPEDAREAVSKLKAIPLRLPGRQMDGFDALAILVVAACNDGTPWVLVDDPASGAPRPDENHHYVKVIQYLAKLYRQRFH